jgi:hypothetical protein
VSDAEEWPMTVYNNVLVLIHQQYPEGSPVAYEASVIAHSAIFDSNKANEYFEGHDVEPYMELLCFVADCIQTVVEQAPADNMVQPGVAKAIELRVGYLRGDV